MPRAPSWCGDLMPLPLLPLVAVPVGIAVAANSSGGTPAQAPTQIAPNGGALISSPTRGMTIGDSLNANLLGGISVGKGSVAAGKLSRLGNISGVQGLVANKITSSAPYSSPIDSEAQAKLDAIAAYGKAAYDQMSADAKKAGAKALSDQLHLDPPLKGDETWETIAKISGGAAGVAAFGWLPGGAVWGPIVGSYLGVKLEELLSKNTDEIEGWFKSKWAGIEGWVKGEVNDAENAVSHFFSSIF